MRFLVLFLGVCGIAPAALFARAGLVAGMSPIALTAWRLTVASIVLLGWRATRGRADRPSWTLRQRVEVAVAGLFMGLHFATWIASLGYVSIARSTLLVATVPLWAGLAGLVVPSLKPRKSFWIGLAVAAVGTWVVTTQGAVWGDGGKAWIGDLLATTGAICLVPYLVLSQRLQETQGSMGTITWMYTSGCVFVWVVAMGFGVATIPLKGAEWGSILGMAVFAQLIGHSSLNWSLKHFSAGQVAMTTLLEPVFAAALAWPILGERVTLAQFLGGAVLLGGVGITLKGAKAKGAEEPNLSGPENQAH